METIRQSTRGAADVTITLSGSDAEIVLAALKMVSHLASGEQVYGAAPGLACWSSAVVDALADQLRADVLTIVHRNYKQTKDGLSER